MIKKRILSMLVLLAAVVTGAYAAVPDKVYYRVYDYSDGKLTYTDNEIAGTGVTEVTNSTTGWANGTYVVTATTTISSRITVTGTVNLIILDGAELTAQKGITVSDGNTLNIYMGNSSNSIQSTGQLNATALDDMDYSTDHDLRGAGIGGYLELDPRSGSVITDKRVCGNVNIHGGKINVQNGSDNVAGIGGSNSGAGGNITIYYSQVTAYGKSYVNAIGAGYYGSGGTVAIYGGNVNAIVTNNPWNCYGIGASLTVGKDVQVYALPGTQSPNVDLSGQTNVAPEGGGQVTTFDNSMFTRYTGPAPAPAVTGYSVSLKSGTEDASNWQGKAGEGNYQALPLEGVEAGTAVTVKYNGTKKVKSVKAKKPDLLSGVFSVSASKKVKFSKGNLRYASGAWSFFDNQDDYYTDYSADAWDKFGWSTSATTYGKNTSTDANTYSGNFVDWGETMGTGWFTLSNAEWIYLFNTRTVNGGTGSGKSYTLGQSVNNKPGVVIYPDNYAGALYTTGANWSTFESAGCVFLPIAKLRDGTTFFGSTRGCYWSSTSFDADEAYYENITTTAVETSIHSDRKWGLSVRLVREVPSN